MTAASTNFLFEYEREPARPRDSLYRFVWGYPKVSAQPLISGEHPADLHVECLTLSRWGRRCDVNYSQWGL